MRKGRNKSTTRRRTPSRRTGYVWLTFLGAMTLVTGLLALTDGGLRGGALIAASVAGPGGAQNRDPIFQIAQPLDRQRWQSIVIHHLGLPAGDAESVNRMHLAYGYRGMGYHFLIGNGNGLGDGIIQVGYRWNEQKPGAHVARVAENSQYHNEHAIGICLIGNGNRRPFTDQQMRSLVQLVRRLQGELGIPGTVVRLHSDLAPEVSSPGRFFAASWLHDQLPDHPDRQ